MSTLHHRRKKPEVKTGEKEHGPPCWGKVEKERRGGKQGGTIPQTTQEGPIKMDATEGSQTGEIAHFGAFLGFRPSTIHSCLPDLQRLHMFSPGGKKHFI